TKYLRLCFKYLKFACQCKCGRFISSEATTHSSLVMETGLISSIRCTAWTKHCSKKTPSERAMPASVCSSFRGNLSLSSENSGPTTSLNRMIGSRNCSEGSLIGDDIFGVLRNEIDQPTCGYNVARRFLVGTDDAHGLDFELREDLLAGGVGRLEDIVDNL